MDRAEVLKEEIKKSSAVNKKKIVVGAGGTKRTKSGDTDEEDKEEEDSDTRKLRDALDSAIIKDKPNVKWEDVAGLESAKASLKEAVLLPLRFPQFFQGNVKPWSGILLYGPPGTGKSFLAQATATEVDSVFFSVSSANLVSKYMGESEKLVKQLFVMARQHDHAIIFIDEVDSLVSTRTEGEHDSMKRLKTEFLIQMQGVGNGSDGLLVLAATNLPWALDPAIRRRFQKRIYIPLPDVHARLQMFVHGIRGANTSLTTPDLQLLAQRTENYSGSDISVVCREALMDPIRVSQNATHFRRAPTADGKPGWTPCPPSHPEAVLKDLYDIASEELVPPIVNMMSFEKALQMSRPSVNQQDLVQFEDWTREYGSEGA
jgi:vacuolar protein-sorting-associated protein 4